MERETVDYIYEYIKIDPNDIPILETEFALQQIQRLEEMQHLGLISRIYRLARHNKREHVYGTYWLCKRLETENTSLRTDNKALRLAAMLHSIGHLPFSYAVEHIVLQLYHIHQPTKDWLDSLFKECIDFVNLPALNNVREDILSTNRSFELYRWFTASKIIKSKKFANSIGRSIIRHLIDRDSFGYQLFHELDRLDYVLRDILYLGLGRIEINFTNFLRQFSRGLEGELLKPSLSQVIEEAEEWLNKEVYMDGRVRCLAQVVGKSILSEVVNGYLTIEELLEINDKEMAEQIKKFKACSVDIDSLIKRIETGELFEVARVECEGGCLVDREAQIAGTKRTGLHKYPDKKGIYIESLPLWNAIDEDLLSIGIVYDIDTGQIKNLVGAFIRAEEWAPDSMDSIELTYRETVFRQVFGLNIRPQFERLRDAVMPTIMRYMYKLWRDMKELPPEGRGDKINLWNTKWEMREWGDFEINISDKESEWLANHFLRFPEHFHTDHVNTLAVTIKNSKRRKGEGAEEFKKRREYSLEYASFLESVINMRLNSRIGWILPCIKLIDKDGQERAEIDCVSISVPRAHHGPVLLELNEVSTDTSSTKQLEDHCKLEQVIYAVRQHIFKGIKIVAMFNGNVIPELSS